MLSFVDVDRDRDLAYILLRPELRDRTAVVARSVRVADDVVLDLDANDQLVGIELLRASSRLDLDRITAEPSELIVGVKEAAEMLGVERSNFIRDHANKPDFPSAIAELASGRFWLRPTIERYISTRETRVTDRTEGSPLRPAFRSTDDALRMRIHYERLQSLLVQVQATKPETLEKPGQGVGLAPLVKEFNLLLERTRQVAATDPLVLEVLEDVKPLDEPQGILHQSYHINAKQRLVFAINTISQPIGLRLSSGTGTGREATVEREAFFLSRLHSEIQVKCSSLYNTRAYAEAVEKGFKVVRDRLRQLTGFETGSEAFGKGRLHIKGAAAPNVEKDFNEAVKFLTMAIDQFRNEKSHSSDAKIDDPARVQEYLALSSLAMNLLEQAEIRKDRVAAPKEHGIAAKGSDPSKFSDTSPSRSDQQKPAHRRVLAAAEEVRPLIALLESQPHENQVFAMEQLTNLAYRCAVEADESVLRGAERLSLSDNPSLQRAAVRLLSQIFRLTPAEDQTALGGRFLSGAIELLRTTTGAVRAEVIEWVGAIADDRASIALIGLIHILPDDEIPEGETPRVAYALKTRSDRSSVEHRLMEEAARTVDGRIRRRFLKCLEEMKR